MNRILLFFVIAVTTLACSSCVQRTGVSYQQTAWKTESFLQAMPGNDLFALKRVRTEDGTNFRFNEGSPSKANHIFPTQVLVKIRLLDEGADSGMKVIARKRGLFFDSSDRITASKWKERILDSLYKN